MHQEELFPECKPETLFCEQKHRETISNKIKLSQNVTKKLKKLLKQLNAMCDKQKEIADLCKEVRND